MHNHVCGLPSFDARLRFILCNRISENPSIRNKRRLNCNSGSKRNRYKIEAETSNRKKYKDIRRNPLN